MIVVIDANSRIHPLFHHNGEQTGYYFLRQLDAFRRAFADGDYLRVYIAFDGQRGTAWRKELEPAYKGGRDEKKPELVELLRQAPIAVMEAGYENVFTVEDSEADDIVASIVTRHADDQVLIISNDKDLHQLLEAGRVTQLTNCSIENGKLVNSSCKFVNADKFKAEYGISPGRWPTWKAIAGDSSDNLGGVPDCGPKCASAMTAKYASVGEIIAAGPLAWPIKSGLKRSAILAAIKSGSLEKWEQITTLRRDCLDLALSEGGA